jgi:hypothetical protein
MPFPLRALEGERRGVRVRAMFRVVAVPKEATRAPQDVSGLLRSCSTSDRRAHVPGVDLLIVAPSDVRVRNQIVSGPAARKMALCAVRQSYGDASARVDEHARALCHAPQGRHMPMIAVRAVRGRSVEAWRAVRARLGACSTGCGATALTGGAEAAVGPLGRGIDYSRAYWRAHGCARSDGSVCMGCGTLRPAPMNVVRQRSVVSEGAPAEVVERIARRVSHRSVALRRHGVRVRAARGGVAKTSELSASKQRFQDRLLEALAEETGVAIDDARS